MSNSLDETNPFYERDEVTNLFLKRHPVHCDFRSGELLRKPLHFHEGYEIYLCIGGNGSYLVEDKLYPLHAGTLTVIGPNVVHHPFSREDSFSRYILTIDVAYLDKLEGLIGWENSLVGQLLGRTTSEHYFLTAAQTERVRSATAELTKLLASSDPRSELAKLNRLTELLLLIAELQHSPSVRLQPQTDASKRLIQEVVAYMAASFRDRITIHGLLERFPLSRSQLLHLFKETTGFTVTQLLTEYRLHHAKRLLTGTELPMTEIAAQSGFGDLSHFHHLFRREIGMTPRQYRQKEVISRN